VIPAFPPKAQLVPPNNGKEYTRVELVQALAQSRSNSSVRSEWIQDILKNKWVPISQRMINKIMKSYEQDRIPLSKIDKPWGKFSMKA